MSNDTKQNYESPKHGGGANDMSDLGRVVSISLSPEQFEQLYLEPKTRSAAQAANIRKFANPTLLGLLGFCTTFTCVNICLMGFGNTSPTTFPALTGVFFLFGGLMLWIAGILEFFIGNTFPMIAFTGFGSFWFVFGTLASPQFDLAGALGGPANGGYDDTVGVFLIVFGFWCFIMTLCTLRINVVFFIIFLTVTITAELVAAGYFAITRAPTHANSLFVAGGAVGFVCICAGWYFLTFLLFETVGFPIHLPVGDLSQRFLRRSKDA